MPKQDRRLLTAGGKLKAGMAARFTCRFCHLPGLDRNRRLRPGGLGCLVFDLGCLELKEDSERAKVLKGVRKLLSDCHGWSTNEYYQLLMDLAEMIDQETKAVEESNT
jgi:hypothetical protein